MNGIRIAAAGLIAIIAAVAAFTVDAARAPRPPREVVVRIDRDNIRITHNCLLEIVSPVIEDADNNGVIQIVGDNLTIRLGDQILNGAEPDVPPDQRRGFGIVITGRQTTIIGGDIRGYKVGVHAIEADQLILHQLRVQDGFRQHLRSTPEQEDLADWLAPHHNDAGEWAGRYGAGVLIERCDDVSLRKVTCRRVQNGIMLDRVTRAHIYDCDASFLSGWGLSMWRSTDNVIRGNAFDFCIRGYSHGVYNRGQDSAGILMFEQCERNEIVDNSVTHGGDGLFAFAGAEALGDVDPNAVHEDAWYLSRGNRHNMIVGNDFSFAAAHGLELTFSFDNRISGNRFVDNGICGIWAGYSQRTMIDGNDFVDNGQRGVGLEHGGINIEHGVDNTIIFNRFVDNTCAIHLWRDEDPGLAALPWTRVNARPESRSTVAMNIIDGAAIGVHLRDEPDVILGENRIAECDRELLLDGSSTVIEANEAPKARLVPDVERARRGGRLGARAELAGREFIIMTPWGPYDWASPLLISDGTTVADNATVARFRLLGTPDMLASDDHNETTDEPAPERSTRFRIDCPTADVLTTFDDAPLPTGTLARFTCFIRAPGLHELTTTFDDPAGPPQRVTAAIDNIPWLVRTFASPVDPREDVDTWREAAAAVFPSETLGLHAHYGNAGPRDDLVDHFGTIAETSIALTPGVWRLRTMSDDGIRVWVDDVLLIDDWTWHAPRAHIAEFIVPDTPDAHEDTRDPIVIRVEHFELDGYSTLDVRLEPTAIRPRR
ncbi:MAG: right-handed parallel beta-helix repeat-containing protein [Phycisphaerales bacterium]|nr:right-handed parallel beta-helix repeat-containing protein [Phycisphaerales bacterium]